MTKSASFLVTMDLPRGATVADAKKYLEDEIKAACGGLNPMEPLFNLDRNSVRVMQIRNEKENG